MATPASERIPDLTLAMVDKEVLVGYDDVAPLRDYATQEFFGALYTRRIKHGKDMSSCAGNIIFSSLGDVGTSFETPYLTYGMRTLHHSEPDGWQFSFTVGEAMESVRGVRTQTFYRVGTLDCGVQFAGKAVREIIPSTEVHIVDEYPIEDERVDFMLDIEPLLPEDCEGILEVMKRVVRRAQVQTRQKRTTVKHAVRQLDLSDFNL